MAASKASDEHACAQLRCSPDKDEKQSPPRKKRRRSYWFSLKNLSPAEAARRKQFHVQMPSAVSCDYHREKRAAQRVADLQYRLDRVDRMDMNLTYHGMTEICRREGREMPKDIVELKVLSSRAFVEDAAGSGRLGGYYRDKVALKAKIDLAFKEYFRVSWEVRGYEPPTETPFRGEPGRGR